MKTELMQVKEWGATLMGLPVESITTVHTKLETFQCKPRSLRFEVWPGEEVTFVDAANVEHVFHPDAIVGVGRALMRTVA